MIDFKIHNIDTAPADAAPVLERAHASFGMVPNLIGVLAEAPSAARAYLDLHEAFAASSFTPAEQQLVLLTTSFQNECSYCMAAESAVAAMLGTDSAVIESLREGRALLDDRLEALSRFTREVVTQRGWVSEEEIDRFLAAGFTRSNILEVILGVTKKTLSNYTNHIADTPLDSAFDGQAWSRPEVTTSSQVVSASPADSASMRRAQR